MPGSKNNVYVKALKCGHWTLENYCNKNNAEISVVILQKRSAKIKKDGTPVFFSKTQYTADISCAKCKKKCLKKFKTLLQNNCIEPS